MNKKEMMVDFIRKLEKEKRLTLFIKNLFDYEEFNDYNYLFRLKEENDSVIIDIYDNISDNRFNRYIFSFTMGLFDMMIKEDGNVYVTYINVFNVVDSDNKLLKLAYLFNINELDKMVDYANEFLDDKIVVILKSVLKKPTY